MRNIFSFMGTTLDGHYEGPDQEFDFWTAEVDTLIFGRVTYEGMAAYWPTPAGEEDDPRVAAKMNGTSKIVVSRTLDKAEWANTRLINDVEELTTLKQQPGKDIAILGSSDLTVSLLEIGLVDELRIMVNPVVLGSGKSLFRTAGERINLKLLKTRPFNSGNALLYDEPLLARRHRSDLDPVEPGPADRLRDRHQLAASSAALSASRSAAPKTTRLRVAT